MVGQESGAAGGPGGLLGASSEQQIHPQVSGLVVSSPLNKQIKKETNEIKLPSTFNTVIQPLLPLIQPGKHIDFFFNF